MLQSIASDTARYAALFSPPVDAALISSFTLVLSWFVVDYVLAKRLSTLNVDLERKAAKLDIAAEHRKITLDQAHAACRAVKHLAESSMTVASGALIEITLTSLSPIKEFLGRTQLSYSEQQHYTHPERQQIEGMCKRIIEIFLALDLDTATNGQLPAYRAKIDPRLTALDKAFDRLASNLHP
jgi:hypothetical protein